MSTFGLVLLAGAVVGTVRWTGGGSPDDVATGPPDTTDVTSGPSGTTGITSDPPGAEEDSPIEGAGILLAAGPPFNSSVAVVDLDDGTISEYQPDSPALGNGSLAGVAVTPRGDAVVWQSGGPVRVVPDAEFSQPAVEIAPTSVRSDPTYATTIWVVPSPDGSQLWIIQPPLPGETSSLVDVVDASTGANIAATEVELAFDPVAATEDSLIVNTGTPDSDDQRVVRLDIDGATQEVATGVSGIAVYGGTVATVDPSGANLSLVDMNGAGEVDVERPSPGRWLPLGEDIIPGESGPFPRVSPEGELLLAIGDGNLDVGDFVSTLYVVSMVDGTTRPLADFEGVPPAAATWSRDGNSVIVVEGTGEPAFTSTVAVLDPDAPESGATVVAELETDYFPLAAG